MLLSVTERILLLGVLAPAEGSILFLKGVRQLREELSFSEEDHVRFKIRPTPLGGVSWDDPSNTQKEVEIGPRAAEYVTRCLKAASDAGRLNEGLLRVWDLVVKEEPE
jgi:hypothetical protein